MLTGSLSVLADLEAADRRREHPRFDAANFAANAALVRPLMDMAKAKGCTPGQLALAWLLAQGDDIVPIPGTKRRSHLRQNLAAIDLALAPEESAALAKAIDASAVKGERYPVVQLGLLGI